MKVPHQNTVNTLQQFSPTIALQSQVEIVVKAPHGEDESVKKCEELSHSDRNECRFISLVSIQPT